MFGRRLRNSRKARLVEQSQSEEINKLQSSEDDQDLYDLQRINRAQKKLDQLIIVKKMLSPGRLRQQVIHPQTSAFKKKGITRNNSLNIQQSFQSPIRTLSVNNKISFNQKQSPKNNSARSQRFQENFIRPRAQTASPKQIRNFILHQCDQSETSSKYSPAGRSQVQFQTQALKERSNNTQTKSQIEKQRPLLSFNDSYSQNDPVRPTPRFKAADQSSLMQISEQKQLRKFIKKGKIFFKAISTRNSARAISPVKPKQCIRQLCLNRVANFLKKKNKFNDDLFPNSLSSIYHMPRMPTHIPIIQPIEWVRLKKQFQRLKPVLFKSMDPYDIKPGMLSHHNLLSAISILCQKPQLINIIFQGQTINNQGIYIVRLRVDGVIRYIQIDDSVPVLSKHQGKSILCTRSFNHGGQFQLWPTLLQKAIAKCLGSYQNIHKIQKASDLLSMCMCAPQQKIYFDSKVIKDQLSAGSLLVLQNCKQSYADLDQNYSYSIIATEGNKLILRNPGWMRGEACQTKLNMQEAQSLFSRVVMFRQRTDWNYISISARHAAGNKTKLILNSSQNGRAIIYGTLNNYFKHNEFVIKFLQKQGRLIQVELKKGVNELTVHGCSQPHQLSICVYSQMEVDIWRQSQEMELECSCSR